MKLPRKNSDIACLLLILAVITAGIHYFFYYKLDEHMDDVMEYTQTVRSNIENAVQNPDETDNGLKLFKIVTETYKLANTYKLVHCEIPKVMSTVMMNIFCYLYNNDIFKAGGASIQSGWWSFRSCEKRNEYWFYKDMLKHLPHGFKMTILIREPFSRFMSAFMNKCIVEPNQYLSGQCQDCTQGPCFGCDLKSSEYMDCVLTRLMENLDKMNDTLDYKRPFHYELSHMAPYTWFCNLRTTYKSSIFLRYYPSGSDKTRMINQLMSVFANENVPKEQLEVIKTSLSTEEKTWHSTSNSDERSIYVNLIKTNSTLFTKLLNIYRRDYKIFDFPLPTLGSSNLFSF